MSAVHHLVVGKVSISTSPSQSRLICSNPIATLTRKDPRFFTLAKKTTHSSLTTLVHPGHPAAQGRSSVSTERLMLLLSFLKPCYHHSSNPKITLGLHLTAQRTELSGPVCNCVEDAAVHKQQSWQININFSLTVPNTMPSPCS